MLLAAALFVVLCIAFLLKGFAQAVDTTIADSFRVEPARTLCGHCGKVIELQQGDTIVQLLDYTIFSELPWDITTLKAGSYGTVCQRCVTALDKGRARFDEPDYKHPRGPSTEELRHLARDI